jgi:hypothetical protein
MAIDQALVNRAHEALQQLEAVSERYRVILDELRRTLSDYLSAPEPEPLRIIRFEATLRFAESESSKADVLTGAVTEPTGTITDGIISQRFRAPIRGRWMAHEFSRFIGSVNLLHQLIAVRDIAMPRLYHGGRVTETRQDVYTGARLYHYLHLGEELRIARVEFASPGEIEFLTVLATHTPQAARDFFGLLALVVIAPRFIQTLPSLYRHCVQEFATAREILRNDRLRQEIHKFFMARLRELENDCVRPNSRDAASETLQKLENTILKLDEAGLANPIILGERVFDSLSSISRLVQSGKASLPQPVEYPSNRGPDKKGG